MNRSRKFFFALASAGALLVGAVGVHFPLQSAGAGSSATITVNTTDDENNGDGDCSLREAIEAANLNVAVDACTSGEGSDTIIIPAGTYTFTTPAQHDVSSNIAFQGAGAASTTIDADGLARVFNVETQGSLVVSFDGLTITGGSWDGDGGGINASRTDLTITNSIITDNETDVDVGNDGGGIRNTGNGSSTTIRNSVISNNRSGDDGGGIQVNSDDTELTITGSSITGNTAQSEGGGIHVDDATTTSIEGTTIADNTALESENPEGAEQGFQGFRGATPLCGGGGGGFNQDGDETDGVPSTEIVNSTISGNTVAECEGGGIYANSDLTLVHVTLVDNGAANGANIFAAGRGFVVQNTIIGDARLSSNCAGSPLASEDGNIQDDESCGFGEADDQTVTDLGLGALASNGGTTDTHLPQAGSPAIDTAVGANCEPVDQRDVTRPQDGDDDGTNGCDVGAVEVVFTPEPTTTEATTTTEGDVGANTATPATPTVARPTFTG